MTTLTCIAVDDEPIALDIISKYIGETPALKLLHTFDDALSAASFLRSVKTDLVFLDINMPDITGLDLVRSMQDPPMIIFITAYKKFAFEGFELNAIDYLLKPVQPERFKKAVQKAVEYHDYKTRPVHAPEHALFVYSEYRMVKIPLPDITYIESLEDYIRIHFRNDKPVMTLMPLKKILEKLPEAQFSRVHRSYVVAHDKIVAIRNRKISLISGEEIPISASHADFTRKFMP